MLRILNTDFHKPLSKQATFRENATTLGSHVLAENHAAGNAIYVQMCKVGQIDTCRAPQS